MKRYNKFYNVSLGNFLKVACCSLSIITIASCEEEPFEEQEINSKSDLQKAASDFRAALKNSGSDVSIAYLDDIENLDIQKAQNLCKNLEEIQGNETITDEVKSFAADLWSKCKSFFGLKKEENKPTDDKPSQKEQKLDRTEGWKKVENAINNLIKKYKDVTTNMDYWKPWSSMLEYGQHSLDADDFYDILKGHIRYLVQDRNQFSDNTEVLELMDKVELEINAFINKFGKAEKWKKIETDVNNLINKFKNLNKDEEFLRPLNSILWIGGDLYNKDFNGDLKCLKFLLYDDTDKKALANNQDVLDLLSKIESEIDAFIDKFDKSELAGGSKVSK